MKQINTYFKTIALFALSSVLIFSCKKEEEQIDIPVVRAGLFILNEGGFMSNNASLSYYNYDTKTLTNDYFASQNQRGLGDTGNDVKIYGSKMYIVVHGSNTVEIVNAKTVKSIKKLSFVNNGTGRQPRYLAFHKNKAFISSFDGTVAVLDTATLSVDKFITVGRNPEQLAVANNKLYVTNSGGLSYPNFDNTVSVIDLNTLTELKKITVVVNPKEVTVDKYGKVYIKSPGDYDKIPATLVIIDSQTDLVTSSKAFEGSSMQIDNDIAYFLTKSGIKSYDVKTNTVIKENIITDAVTFVYKYGLNYDAVNKELFVCDAKNFVSNGEVFCFGLDGKLKYKLLAGIIPNNVIFINK